MMMRVLRTVLGVECGGRGSCQRPTLGNFPFSRIAGGLYRYALQLDRLPIHSIFGIFDIHGTVLEGGRCSHLAVFLHVIWMGIQAVGCILTWKDFASLKMMTVCDK